MPVALIVNDCLSTPEGKNAQFLLPLAAGQKPEDFPLKGLNPSFLVPARGSEGHVVSWSFHGTQRVARKNQKVQLSAEHAQWLMNQVPGLIKLVDETDDGTETTAILMEQVRSLQAKVNVLTTAKEQAESGARAYIDRVTTAEARNQQLAMEKEQALSDAASARQELGLAKNYISQLEQKPNAQVMVAASRNLAERDAYIAQLEARLPPKKLSEARAATSVPQAGEPVVVADASLDDLDAAERAAQENTSKKVVTG